MFSPLYASPVVLLQLFIQFSLMIELLFDSKKPEKDNLFALKALSCCNKTTFVLAASFRCAITMKELCGDKKTQGSYDYPQNAVTWKSPITNHLNLSNRKFFSKWASVWGAVLRYCLLFPNFMALLFRISPTWF